MATRHEIVESFWDLFEGRGDAYGLDEGRCVREQVDYLVVEDHLFNGRTIGIYPLRCDDWDIEDDKPLWTVKWGCADFDEGYDESWPKAALLRDALAAAGIHAWIERSRSKGYHVWVFADGWVSAADMRRTLLAGFQVAGLQPKEVNPKAEGGSDPSFLGNYVRLPYPKGAEQAGRQVVTVEGELGWYDLESFLEAAHNHRVPGSRLAELGKLYVPPPRREYVLGQYEGTYDELLDKAGDRLRRRVKLGLFEDEDRSTYLARCARYAEKDGFTPGETRSLVEYLDRTVTQKYVDRADPDRYYNDIVELVYGEA